MSQNDVIFIGEKRKKGNHDKIINNLIYIARSDTNQFFNRTGKFNKKNDLGVIWLYKSLIFLQQIIYETKDPSKQLRFVKNTKCKSKPVQTSRWLRTVF